MAKTSQQVLKPKTHIHIICLAALAGLLFSSRAHAQMPLRYGAWNYTLPQDTLIKKDTAAADELPSPNKTALRSALIPGWGQWTNGGNHRWKVPAIYAGFATMGYFIFWNNREYIDFRDAYRVRIDNDSTTFDKYDINNPNLAGRVYSANGLLVQREYFRRNRDLLVILTAVLYAANILDAYVYAHLREFEINPDLKLAIEPIGFANIANRNTLNFGVKLKF